MSVDEALVRLQAAKGQWPKICEETGLDYSWLTKFAQGQIKNPSARKIEQLATHPLMTDEAA